MSKNETIETEEINLNILISNIENSLSDFFKEKNGQIYSAELPIIISNNSLLHAALKNLIINGIMYNTSEVPIVEVRYQSTELYYEIIVSDNGIGIEKAYQEKIFDMLEKLHHRGVYEGSGIGLSIVKLVCKKLDGTIELNSEVGKGSIFVLRLPKPKRENN
jgi:light-regulated signal transduction histidine kinase (bacteriophytochrome)